YLRHIAGTAPYMHDGSAANLSEVLDHYASGGRTIAAGPSAGVGHDNLLKDPLIHGFRMTARKKADLIAFLESLTDQDLLGSPELADPWVQVPGRQLRILIPRRLHVLILRSDSRWPAGLSL